MRALVIGICLFAGALVASDAEAHRSKARTYASDADRYEYRQREDRRWRGHRYSRDSEADEIRANSCDPGGRFSGYPAWARAAFSCGSQR